MSDDEEYGSYDILNDLLYKDQYFRDFGEFINKFSRLEVEVAMLLSAMAGITDEVSRAIFSGTRMRNAIRSLPASQKRRLHRGSRAGSEPTWHNLLISE